MDEYKIFTAKKILDNRGLFSKIYNSSKILNKLKTSFKIDEICISKNKKKLTFRGFHYQEFPNYQKKIVFCNKGKVFDYFIDLRKKSPNFLRVYRYVLSEQNSKIIYIPKGFAHGFLTLTDKTEIIYIISGLQKKSKERGIRFNDKILKYNFPKKIKIISNRDLNFKDFEK